MGNKCVTKVDEKVAIVFEQFIRLMHDNGLPKEDMVRDSAPQLPIWAFALHRSHSGAWCSAQDYIYSNGPVMNELLVKGDARMTLFTGSQAVAEKLTIDLKGKVKLEDAGDARAPNCHTRAVLLLPPRPCPTPPSSCNKQCQSSCNKPNNVLGPQASTGRSLARTRRTWTTWSGSRTRTHTLSPARSARSVNCPRPPWSFQSQHADAVRVLGVYRPSRSSSCTRTGRRSVLRAR